MREYIEKKKLIDCECKGSFSECDTCIKSEVCASINEIQTFTEQEIVKPYLAKILNNIVDDDYLRKNMSGEVWERVEDIVSNILSENGEEE